MFKITNTTDQDDPTLITSSTLELDVSIVANEYGISMRYIDYGYNHVDNYIEGRTTFQLLKLILYTSS